MGKKSQPAARYCTQSPITIIQWMKVMKKIDLVLEEVDKDH